MRQRYQNGDDILMVGGQEYTLTYHVNLMIIQRQIEKEWIAHTLANWVAKKYDIHHRSINYYGIIRGRKPLFMVAVSEYSSEIPSAYFHSGASARYRRKEYGYFDEVRDESDS